MNKNYVNLLKSSIFGRPSILRTFIYCLSKTNKEDKEIIKDGETIVIKKYTFILDYSDFYRYFKNDFMVKTRLYELDEFGFISLDKFDDTFIVTVNNVDNWLE